MESESVLSETDLKRTTNKLEGWHFENTNIGEHFTPTNVEVSAGPQKGGTVCYFGGFEGEISPQ